MAASGLVPTRRPRARALPYLVAILLVAVTAALAWYGWSFYRLPLDQRVEHPAYQELRPSGLVGNGLGYAAALLVFANLSYLARRKQLFRLGSMQTWLGIHVFTGLLAGVLAAFHSAFQLRTPIARVTAISIGVVVVTGIIGRVLHVFAARFQKSWALTLLRSWRGFHRLFALLMLALVGLHAAVAWYYGYRWIFG